MGARVLIGLFAVLAACEKESKLYCGLHPTDLANCGYLDAGIDARPPCTGDPDCAASPGAPYCEPNARVCVECYLPEHCASQPDEKFCDPDTFSCRSCLTSADCASRACLPSGVCGDDGNVAYVDPTAPTTNTACTFAAKCRTIAAALTTKRPYIKLEGSIVEQVPALSATTVTLLAEPGTTLTRPSGGVILDIGPSSDVAIYDLQIVGNDNIGVLVDKSTLRLVRSTVTGCNTKDKRAVEAKMSSTLIVSRSTIAANAGGGILTDPTTTFNITNTFIYRNGANDTAVGGASLLATSSGLNRFEMNTVADNRVAATADAGGLYCASSLRAPNNLIVRNYAGGNAGALNANKPIAGGCDLRDSQIDPDPTKYAFAMAEGTTGPWDYHIRPGSLAIDRGVPSDITVDFDGDARPQSTQIDFGADEYK